MAIEIGLVGAGPWAKMFHAQMISAGPETKLTAIWARRPDAAAELALGTGANVATSFENMLDHCEAVVFAVPPDVQARYAPIAARAGKALLLEKPIGLSLYEAERMAGEINATGAVNQVMMTNRYDPLVRRFLGQAATRTPIGAIATYLGNVVDSPFATPWRVARGALLDLGPHVLDLLDVTLGPITKVQGRGDPTRWFAVTAHHVNGAISQSALSLAVPVKGRSPAEIRLFTQEGELNVNFVGGDGAPNARETIRSEFAQAVISGKSHEIDVNRALYIQRLLDEAERTALE